MHRRWILVGQIFLIILRLKNHRLSIVNEPYVECNDLANNVPIHASAADAANIAAVKENGGAKIECSYLIFSRVTPTLCEGCMCLLVDQCQRVSSFDPLSVLTRPGNRQQSPSFWTVRRRHTSAVSAHYGFNKCKSKAMPL
jgi:hypothetical protein